MKMSLLLILCFCTLACKDDKPAAINNTAPPLQQASLTADELAQAESAQQKNIAALQKLSDDLTTANGDCMKQEATLQAAKAELFQTNAAVRKLSETQRSHDAMKFIKQEQDVMVSLLREFDKCPNMAKLFLAFSNPK
jgi:hypothetical protein